MNQGKYMNALRALGGEATIKEMREHLKEKKIFNTSHHAAKSMMQAMCRGHVIRTDRAKYKILRKDGWISVEDGLPAINEEVWASNGVDVDLGFRSNLDNKNNWCDFWFKVTHWKLFVKPEAPGTL